MSSKGLIFYWISNEKKRIKYYFSIGNPIENELKNLNFLLDFQGKKAHRMLFFWILHKKTAFWIFFSGELGGGQKKSFRRGVSSWYLFFSSIFSFPNHIPELRSAFGLVSLGTSKSLIQKEKLVFKLIRLM